MTRNAGRVLVSTAFIEERLAFPEGHRVVAATFNPGTLVVEFIVEGPTLPAVGATEQPPLVTALCSASLGALKPERIITVAFKAAA